MTPEEIQQLKQEISQTISKRMEEAFIGQSIRDVSAAVVKAHLNVMMEDLRSHGSYSRWAILGLIDWSVRFEGNAMHIVMEPKKGLDAVDHRRAINFLFNQGVD